MEPDKSMLSETIYRVESKPVSWNKAQVWERLQQADAGRSTYRRWYRVAAAVLLLMLSLPAWKSPRVAPAAIQILSCTEPIISAPAVKATPAHEHRVTVHRQMLLVNTSPVESPIAATPSAKQDSVVRLPTVASSSIATMAYTDRRDTMEKIEPVVGVVLTPEKPLVMSKSRRRKLLHTLEPFEKSIDVQDANTIVLARTKQ
jgi:hypothetical protein